MAEPTKIGLLHALGELFPRHGAGLSGLWRPPIDSALGYLRAAKESAARSNLELNTDVSNVERAINLQRDFASRHDKTLGSPVIARTHQRVTLSRGEGTVACWPSMIGAGGRLYTTSICARPNWRKANAGRSGGQVATPRCNGVAAIPGERPVNGPSSVALGRIEFEEQVVAEVADEVDEHLTGVEPPATGYLVEGVPVMAADDGLQR